MNTVVFVLAAIMASVNAFAPAGARFARSALNMANIVDTAKGAGTFNTLVAAIEAAGLTGTLSGGAPGAFTVFAPTDAAFEKLPAGTVDGLLKDPATLKDILLFHTVEGFKRFEVGQA